MSVIAKLANCKAVLGVMVVLFILSGVFDCAIKINADSENQNDTSSTYISNQNQENTYEGISKNPYLFFFAPAQSSQQDSTFKTKKTISINKIRSKTDGLLKHHPRISQYSGFVTTFQSRFRRTCPDEDSAS